MNDEANENKRSAKVDSYTRRTLCRMVNFAKKHVKAPEVNISGPTQLFGDI
jgi:hypothetical protein